MERVITFCTTIIIKPIPNSAADKTKNKKVSETKLRLSYIRPETIVMAYRVIHKNSAVRSKCRDVLTFTTTLNNIIKKKSIKTFISPKLIV